MVICVGTPKWGSAVTRIVSRLLSDCYTGVISVTSYLILYDFLYFRFISELVSSSNVSSVVCGVLYFSSVKCTVDICELLVSL